MQKFLKRKDVYYCATAVLLLVGCAVRLWGLSTLPCGLHQDEAFAGYEAWALLNHGTDSVGYHNPVYFTSWGSGMNALEIYMMLPFVALFGTATTALRLPQAIVGCLSLFAVYGFGKRAFGRRFALGALAVLALCPWHIIMSRWAMESNLAPGFLLFGLYCFVRGLTCTRWLYASAVAYGLSLYAYATIWPIVPLIVLLQVGYALAYRKLYVKKLLGPAVILFLFALPLLWFLGVQMGFLSEIRTAVFSIPKMLEFRGNEISLSHIGENLRTAWRVLWNQCDSSSWTEQMPFGLYYPFWLPLAALGLYALVTESLSAVKQHVFTFQPFILFNLFGAVVLCALIEEVNVVRMNAIHIPILLCIAYGIYFLCRNFGLWIKVLFCLLYGICFLLFGWQTVTTYNDAIRADFNEGLRQAVVYAQQVRGDLPVFVNGNAYYSQVLLFAEVPPSEFSHDDVRHFDGITMGYDSSSPYQAVYVIPFVQQESYAKQGYSITPFALWATAIPPAE